jgi:glycosyltransferase involved in cell wall biosynthesis
VPRQPHSICFVGLFKHEPNAQAAQVLIDEILPRLRGLFPNARLVLVGRDPTQEMLRAAQRDAGILVTGPLVDTRSFLAACDLTVVPLATGGGTRLKILEAFASGIPVVSTSVGAEGLQVRDGEQLLIGDTVDELVESAAAVWQNHDLAMSLADRAYALVTGAYSSAAVSCKIHAAMARLLERGDLPTCQDETVPLAPNPSCAAMCDFRRSSLVVTIVQTVTQLRDGTAATASSLFSRRRILS